MSYAHAMLPPKIKDPLNELPEKMRRHLLLLNLLGHSDGTSSFQHLESFQIYLKSYSPAQLVSMFPEKGFTALTLIEYALNYFKFAMHDPKVLTIDYSERMAYWGSLIAGLKHELKKLSLLDVEVAHRVEACYQEIKEAFVTCHLLAKKGGILAETEEEKSRVVKSFFKTRFSTDNEERFMSSLRDLYWTEMPCTELFPRLEDLFSSTDLSQVTRSDVKVFTALRMILSCLETSLKKESLHHGSSEKGQILMSNIAHLNSSSFTYTHTESYTFSHFSKERINQIHALLERYYGSGFYKPSKFCGDLADYEANDKPSVLWLKLTSPESSNILADSALLTSCALCKKDSIRETNFAILDSCSHLYCLDCALDWFKAYSNTKCPECGAEVKAYTSRAKFQDVSSKCLST